MLEVFVKAMNKKMLVSIVTDSDKVMSKAIKHVFPNATHGICAWHLQRYDQSNIGDVNFTANFKSCMLGDLDVNEFECRQKGMVEKFGVEDNPWVKKIYKKK